MVLQAPQRVKNYVWYWCVAPERVRLLLIALVTGMLLVRGRRTLANLIGAVVMNRRHPSNVSRFFQHHADDLVECYSRASRRAINRGVRIARKRGNKRWLLAVDTTFQRKHALTMPNLITFKEKSKGVPAGNHAFVIGMLIGPGGVRIPLAVQDFLTKEFLRAINDVRKANHEAFLKHRTQVDLAVSLIQAARALLPADMELWVVADNFFEGTKLDRACCAKTAVYYIVPLDTGRVITSESKTAKGLKVRAYEKTIPDVEFGRVALAEGKEPFAFLHRRESNPTKRKRGRRKEKVYQVAKRCLDLKGLGKRNVFFSWKQRRFHNDSARAKAHLKMLVTNHPSASAAEIVEGYSMRWQVELLYRELKSDLGIGHYQVVSREGIRAHIHVALLAFLMMEMYRLDLLEKEDPRWIARYAIPKARTRQLVHAFEVEARREDLGRALEGGRDTKRNAELLRRLEPRRVAAKA
jgi:hypothetical protein